MKYFKNESYYNDLYDRFTVEDCRETEKWYLNSNLPKFKEKSSSLKGQTSLKRSIADIILYFKKGERYSKKQDTIQKWMVRDKKLDDVFEQARQPENIHCQACGSTITSNEKTLYDISEDNPKVLFFFECTHCSKRKGIFDNGEEFKSSPLLCPKCQNEMKTSYTRKDNIITTTYKCTNCPHKETETLDLDKKPVQEKIDKEFQKDRQKFCMTEAEGQEYVKARNDIEQFNKYLAKVEERKTNKDLYDKVAKIKKLKITELEKLVKSALEKDGFIKLELSKPEFSRYIIVNFTVQDTKTDRGEYDSKNDLKKLINRTLLDTNWRLMSEGITYRLGYLYSRLKACEHEEDLITLVQTKQKRTKLAGSTSEPYPARI